MRHAGPQGELPPLADVDEILDFIERAGVDQIASEGGFIPPDIEGAGEENLSSSATSASAPAAASAGATAAAS